MSTLIERYRFFKEHAGYIVGKAAVCALALARAEAEGERRGLTVVWEDEDEEWDGDCDPPEVCLYAACFKAEDVDEYQGVVKNRRATCYANLGMIGLNSYRDPYMRVVRAELFAEALLALDEEDQDAADVLAMRPTYAAGGGYVDA